MKHAELRGVLRHLQELSGAWKNSNLGTMVIVPNAAGRGLEPAIKALQDYSSLLSKLEREGDSP